jgi:hypothetical protein
MRLRWRSSISYSEKVRTPPRVSELSLSGKMMKLIYSSMASLLIWSRTISLLKTSQMRIGSNFLKLFLQKTQKSATNDGSLYRNWEATSRSGQKRMMKSSDVLFRNMVQEIGLIFLRNLTRCSRRWAWCPQSRLVTKGMESSAERDGWLLWIHPSIKSIGV